MRPDDADPIDTGDLDAPAADGTAVGHATTDPGIDSGAVLDGFEADLAAVETAMVELDRISGDGAGGDDAARAIQVAVPPERFAVAGDALPSGSDLVRDGLLDQ